MAVDVYVGGLALGAAAEGGGRGRREEGDRDGRHSERRRVCAAVDAHSAAGGGAGGGAGEPCHGGAGSGDGGSAGAVLYRRERGRSRPLDDRPRDDGARPQPRPPAAGMQSVHQGAAACVWETQQDSTSNIAWTTYVHCPLIYVTREMYNISKQNHFNLAFKLLISPCH